MYQPDTFDLERLRERASQFGAQVSRNARGELSDDDLRPLRLQNGLYVQRHAPMLRIGIAYGMLRSEQLRALAAVARTYDRSYGHFTTRQNLQLNWITIEDAPRALADLAEVGLHGIQTSGNCLRNISSDVLAGIAPEEILDPRVYAELLRQWSSFHPEFTFLPRKFKVAFSGTPQDRALVQLHDLAFEAVAGEPDAVFRVRVGGGMGRTPVLGPVIRERLHWQDLLTYSHAVMRVYNEMGRRDNIFKARIKILVRAMGAEPFAALVEDEWSRLRDGPHRIPEAERDRVRDAFVEPDWSVAGEAGTPAWNGEAADAGRYRRWLARNRLANRNPGFAAVLVPLKNTKRPPGDATSEEMEQIADLAERFSQGFVRVSHAQDLLLPAVRERDLPALFLALDAVGLNRALGGLIGDMVCCPGGDFCSLANARSIPVAEDIAERYADLDRQEDLGPLDLRISGCMNSCGHHHTGHLGILGVDKAGASFYQVLVGGHSGHDGAPAALGSFLGKAFAEDEIGDAVEAILDAYVSLREPGESFREAGQRLGREPFATAADAVRKALDEAPERSGLAAAQTQDSETRR